MLPASAAGAYLNLRTNFLGGPRLVLAALGLLLTTTVVVVVVVVVVSGCFGWASNRSISLARSIDVSKSSGTLKPMMRKYVFLATRYPLRGTICPMRRWIYSLGSDVVVGFT